MNEASQLQTPGGLRPVLGRWQLLCVGIGAIIGSGIFVIPGPAAAQFAGPGVVISFLIAALGCALAGLCYAELSAMFPAAGSAYAYSSRVFGRAAGWVVGWLLVLEYLFAAAIVSQACAAYAMSFFDIENASYARVLMMILPWMVLAGVSWIAIRGVEQSASVVAAIVLVKVGVIVLVIAFGAAFVDTDRWTPLVPENTGVWGEYGWSGVLRAAGIVFYTYLGFDTVSVAAQEARQPQRDVPFALLGSLILCTVLFIAMMLVVTGLVDYRALNVANPVAVAIGAAGERLRWLAPVVEIGAMIGMVSVLLVILMAQARILYAMASDGLLPPALARLHSRWQTPANGTVLTAAVAGLIALLVPVSALGQMVSVGVLTAFIAVAIAVLVWRRRQPDAPRPFRVPAVPLVPIGAVLVCSYMAASLPLATWWRFLVWLALGGLLYAIYGKHNRDLSK